MSEVDAAYRVRVDDLNYGGHMGHERALLVFQDARIAFLAARGHTEQDIGDGLGLIVAEARVRYRKEVALHDVLRTEVGVGELQRSSFELSYRTRRVSDDARVLEGSTRLLAFDYRERAPARIPERLRARLEEARGS